MSFSSDRRTALRTFTMMSGRIYHNSARPSLDCRIRNISDGGACLRAEGVGDMPDRFRLEIPARNSLVAAHVRWRDEHAIGVAFEPLGSSAGRRAPEAVRLAEENRILREKMAALAGQLASLGMPVDL